jgi:hypothetical protein
MKEVIKFDILGERRVVFDDDGVMYCASDKYTVVPSWLGDMIAARRDKPIPYNTIRSVRRLRKRQWWTLFVGLLFTFFSIAGLFGDRVDTGVIVTCLLIFALLGAFPLWLFYRGRSYLVLRADREGFYFPMDRNKKAVREILKQLMDRCQGLEVQWEL